MSMNEKPYTFIIWSGDKVVGVQSEFYEVLSEAIVKARVNLAMYVADAVEVHCYDVLTGGFIKVWEVK